MDVKEKILDAIQLLAENSVQRAGYDRTIQAQIVSCEDATIGKYRCRYQDSTFYAYAGSSDITFGNNSYVYVLVPGNDFSKEKTILGTTQKLGINYISQAEGDEAYDVVGTNCINSNDIYYLDTNNKNYQYVIYDSNNSSNIIDITSLNQYIKQSSSLIAGATFKTSIPPERQSRGHYGIIYNLVFKDNATNENVTRSYIINEDNMIDNPYRLLYPTRQYQIFDIDGGNFVKVDSIIIFNSDFPEADGNTTTGRLNSGDIQITNLELSGAIKMTESEINGVSISFFTPQGTFFTESSSTDSTRKIVAQVKVKGKLVSAAQKIPFYWGKENVGITPSSTLYNKYLGRGWACLNKNNIVSEGSNMEEPVVEWVPEGDTYIVEFSAATARDNKYKVAIIYDNTVVTKQITIRNLAASVPEITIVSDKGNQFYYDIGHPTLTCLINGAEIPSYTYYWAYESDTGVFNELPETTDLNNAYTTAINTLNTLQTSIANGTEFAKAKQTQLTNAKSAVNEYNFIQRVQGNKVYDVQIKNITNRGIFKCSVYNGNTYLGTAAITLTNTLDGERLYSLIINNGSQTFQYNENGVAPNNKSLDDPQTLETLSFTIYDNLGQPIDPQVLLRSQNCSIRWEYPIKDTLLVEQAENNPNSGTDATQSYIYYDNALTLVYGIKQKYDVKKKVNQIKLNINYKGMNLTTETDFTFVKQGEPGTNGTQFIVKLIPNTRIDDPPLWPMITKAGSKYFLNYGINTQVSQQEIGVGAGNNYQLFKAQLWHNGQLVWQGFSAVDAAIDGTTKPTMVHWEILQNKYNTSFSDESALGISNADSGQIYYTGDHLNNNFTTPLANIIKCSITWQGKLYYATIPIITAWTSSENYRVSLKDYTGFRYVIYTSDGMTPQYDNAHPFEFICQEKINNIWEDISLVEGSHKISYTPSSCSNIISQIVSNTPTYRNENLLQLLDQEYYRDGLQNNQWNYRPKSRYDGQCVNAAVLCTYTQNNTVIGKINIPIHFLLNKYGLANINEWDGNSVQINEQGGYILAPQMGAGTKNNNNNFTGVLMGQVKVAGKTNPDTGLLGYSAGDRTFFLNSDNGSAIFGKANTGQIIIDPNGTKALLYSSSYWKNYNSETGLPTSYGSGNVNTSGMLIDLTTPEIKFGSGNFSVNSSGYLTAKGGGSIAGWKISDTTLKSAANNLTLDSSTTGSIYSNNHTALTNTGNGFFISQDGLSIGNKFKVTSTGIVTVGNGAVNDSSAKHWTIDTTGSGTTDNSYISYNTTTFGVNGTNPYSSVYIGTDGISLGRQFSVDSDGNVQIIRGSISMGSVSVQRQATGADIGSAFQDDPLYVNDGTAHSGILWHPEGADYSSVTYENTGIPCLITESRPMFYVSTNPSKLEIHIRDGSINLGNKFIVTNKGFLTAMEGNIAGFKITNQGNAPHISYKTDTFRDPSATENSSYIGSLYLGTDGISLGKGFSVDLLGNVSITKGSIHLRNPSNGKYFYVDTNGEVTATDVSAGGIHILGTGTWTTSAGTTAQYGEVLGGVRDNNNNVLEGFTLMSTGEFQIGPTSSRWTIMGSAQGSTNPGVLRGSNGNYFECQIEPGSGMGKFQNLDVANNITIGGDGVDGNHLGLRGYKYVIPGETSTSVGTNTFWIEAATGNASFESVNVNNYKGFKIADTAIDFDAITSIGSSSSVVYVESGIDTSDIWSSINWCNDQIRDLNDQVFHTSNNSLRARVNALENASRVAVFG